MGLSRNKIPKNDNFAMPYLHQKAIQKVADKFNVVIGICPVNWTALSFIEAGYPAKPYVVKNKTCDIGFAAGLIPVNPEYSQVEEQDYLHYQHQLNDALSKDSNLQSIPCVLSKNRLDELKLFFGDAIQLQFSSDEQECRITWDQGKKMEVIARINTDNNDYTIYDGENNVVQVLGREIMDAAGAKMTRPITADYDLAVVCPSNEDHDPHGADKTPFSTKGELRQIQSIIKASASAFYLCPKEDPKMGNVSKRIRDIVKALNAALAEADQNCAGVNLERFHHNAAWFNPTAEEVKYPIMMIEPRQMNAASQSAGIRFFSMQDQSISLVNNSQELQQKIRKIEASNYHWPSHAVLDVNVFEERMFPVVS